MRNCFTVRRFKNGLRFFKFLAVMIFEIYLFSFGLSIDNMLTIKCNLFACRETNNFAGLGIVINYNAVMSGENVLVSGVPAGAKEDFFHIFLFLMIFCHRCLKHQRNIMIADVLNIVKSVKPKKGINKLKYRKRNILWRK